MTDTIAVRDDDLVDRLRLREWLEARGIIAASDRISVRQYPAGFSNLTYLVTATTPAGQETSVVLRRPPRGVSGGVAHDMTREHGILAALHPLGIPVPRALALCTDVAVLGAPFYVMERVAGVILRGAHPAELSGEPATQRAQLSALSSMFVETLAALHRVPVTDPRLASLGRPEGYAGRQVEGWARRWERSRTEPVAELDDIAAWLAANVPADSATPALVHNDFKFDNLVLSADLTSVRAILDWEMATLGDPLMDLGTSLAYWVEAGDPALFRSLGLGVTALPGARTRAELVDAYQRASGNPVPYLAFYRAFGLFKVAIIAQQIFARHVRGLTTDPRFGALGEVVRALGRSAVAVVEKGE